MDSNSNSHKKSKIVGIVTRGVELGAGKSLICVWNSRSPLKEYKFPRWASEYTVWFNWGEIVWIEPSKSVDEVQDPRNISKLEPDNERLRKIEVTYPIGHEALFLVMIVAFPPPSVDHYRDELAASKSLGCRAIGWSVEMGKVALLDEALVFKPGVCYSGYVARIAADKDWIAEKMGTLWVVDGSTSLNEIADAETIGRMQQRIPWRNSLVPSMVGSAIGGTSSGAFASSSYDVCPSQALPPPLSHSQHFSSANAPAPPPPSAHRPLLLSDDWTDELDDPLRNAASCSMDISRPSRLQPHHSVGAPPPLQQKMNNDSFLCTTPTQSNSKMLVNHQQMGEEQRRQQPQQHQFLSFQEGDTTANNRENVVFGNLVALKLESIHARNANAAIQLQKAIMELCSNFELKVLNSNQYNNDHFSELGKAFGMGAGRE
ncbi:hypothetical protein niasHT_027619 [Heterodera trifolii]|uniref:Uncharacterized protein n=1 Tax=Heterodera trifolii TaxID=157864 RepID=A0ABD2K5K7_9BILA